MKNCNTSAEPLFTFSSAVDENVRHYGSTGCRVEGVAIVFALEEETLRTIMHETLGSVLTVAEA